MKVGKDGWLPVNRKTGIDITGEFEIRSPESLLLISDNNNPTHGIPILQGVSKVRSDFLFALIIKKKPFVKLSMLFIIYLTLNY